MKRKALIWTGCIIIVGAIGIWAMNSGNGYSGDVEPVSTVPSPPSPSASVTIPNVTPSPETQISSPPPITVQDVKPEPETVISEPPVLQPEKEAKQVEVPITKQKPTPKPTEPPKPKPKATDKPQSPKTPPSYDEKETQPNKPKPSNEPKVGDKNENGKVFVPGFGWIEQKGPSQGSKSESDGDWNKQVGTMD